MASFSRMYHDGMEAVQPGLIPRDSEIQHELFAPEPVFVCQTPDHGVVSSTSSDAIPSSPTHKSSQFRFLTWVAYTRNLARRITELQRCTCPMIGCELSLDSPDLMLQHVQVCPRLSKGRYRCLESGKSEKIGKCDTIGCLELRGRLVAAVSSVNSSIKSVTRRLSGRGSKSRRIADSESANPEKDSNWDGRQNTSEFSYTGSPLSTLMDVPWQPVPWQSVPYGVDEKRPNSEPSELGVDHSSTTESKKGFYAQSFPQEHYTGGNSGCSPAHRSYSCPTPDHVDFGFGSSPVPAYVPQPEWPSVGLQTFMHESWNTVHVQAEPFELCATNTSTRTLRSVHQQSTGTSSYTQFHDGEATDKPQVGLDAVSNLYQASCQTSRTLGTPESSDETVVDELVNTVKPYESWATYSNMYQAPRSDNGINFDSVSPPACSNTSTISDRKSSMSSAHSSTAAQPGSQTIPATFFSDPDVMIEKPESSEVMLSSARYGPHQVSYGSEARRTVRNGVSIDEYISPGLFVPNMKHHEDLPKNQNQSLRSPTLFSPEPVPLPPTNSDNLYPPPLNVVSRRIQTPALRRGTCKHYPCPFVPINGKTSNLSRHESRCPYNPERSSKSFKCYNPGCYRTYNRRDNLLVHQKAQKHLETLQFQVQVQVTPRRRRGT